MADDDFTLNGDSSNNVEASLDDFFQPAAGPEKKAESQPAVEAYETAPVPKGEQLPEISEVEPVTEEKPKEPRKFLPSRILIIIIVVLGVAVLGAGGYFAYTMFLAKDSDFSLSFFGSEAPPPVEKPAPVLEPETGEIETVPGEASAPPDKQEGKPGESAVSETRPERPSATVPGIKELEKAPNALDTPPREIPIQKPAAEKPKKTVGISKGPYTIQVGSYMMKESMAGPEEKLFRLGLTDYHYLDTERTMRVYDVYVGGIMKKSEAEAIQADLAGIGFKPTLKKEKGDSCRVLAYSYGSRSVANQTKAKIEKAGIGKVEVKSGRRRVTLHQLRVGHFSSARDAQGAINTLKKAGFDTILVKEK
jgi:cell division protein FtsN